MVEDLKQIALMDAFYALIRQHDFAYELSHNEAAWERGDKERKAIKSLARKLIELGSERSFIEAMLLNRAYKEIRGHKCYMPEERENELEKQNEDKRAHHKGSE